MYRDRNLPATASASGHSRRGWAQGRLQPEAGHAPNSDPLPLPPPRPRGPGWRRRRAEARQRSLPGWGAPSPRPAHPRARRLPPGAGVPRPRPGRRAPIYLLPLAAAAATVAPPSCAVKRATPSTQTRSAHPGRDPNHTSWESLHTTRLQTPLPPEVDFRQDPPTAAARHSTLLESHMAPNRGQSRGNRALSQGTAVWSGPQKDALRKGLNQGLLAALTSLSGRPCVHASKTIPNVTLPRGLCTTVPEKSEV